MGAESPSHDPTTTICRSVNPKSKTQSHAVHRAALLLATVSLLASRPHTAAAQVAPPVQSTGRFDNGIVLGSDWLQANALPLNRQAVHSGTIDASYRLGKWTVDAGWLRVARDFSTVQGGFLSG